MRDGDDRRKRERRVPLDSRVTELARLLKNRLLQDSSLFCFYLRLHGKH